MWIYLAYIVLAHVDDVCISFINFVKYFDDKMVDLTSLSCPSKKTGAMGCGGIDASILSLLCSDEVSDPSDKLETKTLL